MARVVSFFSTLSLFQFSSFWPPNKLLGGSNQQSSFKTFAVYFFFRNIITGLMLGMISTPVSGLVYPGVSWGAQSWWVSSSFPRHSLPHSRGLMGFLPFGPCPKERPSFPHYHYFLSTKGGGGDIAGGALSHWPLQGHCWPLGKLSASDGTAGQPSCPLLHPSVHTFCQILQVSQIKELQQALPLQVVWKANFKLGFYSISLSPGASWDLSSLSPMWDEVFRCLKVLSPW